MSQTKFKAIKTIKLFCNYKPRIIVTLKLWIIATRIMVTDTKIAEISDVQIAECSSINGDFSDVSLWLL